ncbi:MAG: hypothetical protein ACMUJM_10585 [bacterium]
MKRILLGFEIMILILLPASGNGFCALKDRLKDPYYDKSLTRFSVRLLYGGVNSSTENKKLQDVRGGGMECEYEKLKASAFFSAMVGLGFITLDDSSTSRLQYLDSLFAKVGFNFIGLSYLNFMELKIGPDIRCFKLEATDNNNRTQSHLGLGMGLNISVEFAIKPKWFVGGGLREGIVNYSNEELQTRFLFLHLQRSF